MIDDMKKFFFILLIGLLAVGSAMAQKSATAVTIKNWDGSALSANEPLFIRPGQTLSLKLDLTPADADSSTIKLSMTM